MLLTAALGLLVTGTAQRAGAEDKEPSGAGTANVQVCEAAGGIADVTTGQTGAGWQDVYVACNGGLLDGWDCHHSNEEKWNCTMESRPDLPGPDETIDLGEVGLAPEVLGAIPPSALPGFVSIVPTLDAGPPSQEQDHNPGKHGKHGKKGGKHRKR
ncbi:MAG: hypothetical protein K0Q89_2559 [Thermomicrobiales bacterium]|jgi:hypothetical protein|nr:hypothetical protein [Thermomicrobiales bacterium]